MITTSAIRRLAFIVLLTLATPAGLVEAADTRAAAGADEIGSVRLLVGRSAIVNTGSPIARISLTSSDIADAMVTQPNQLLIQGKLPGTITMFVWNRAGAMSRYDVIVERDLSTLSHHMRDLFPGQNIIVASNGKSVVISGTVSSKELSEKATEVAAGHVEKKEDVVNLLQVNQAPTPQVLLRVRFAEVSRNALTELGASYFTGPNGYKDWAGRGTTQQYPAPDWGEDGTKLTFSDFLNVFLFNMKHDLGVAIRALQSRGMFQSLAEPNLVAESGKEASFLAGGEFPIPIAQGGTNLAISVIFKEFGVRLNFTPTVTAENRIRLKVRPEVSTLDFANAIVLQGFRIPALSTRRTETEVELANGQTFAIAGLLNNTATEALQKIPGIGDIPILGYLFRSKAAQKNRTELVVMITPEILPTGSPGVTTETPRLQEPYLPPQPIDRSHPTPGPAFTPAGDNPALVPRPSGSSRAVPVAPGQTTAESAAAVLRSNMPKGPTMMTLDTQSTGAPAEPAAVATPTPQATQAAEAAAREPEMRPMTKDEKKRFEKAREAERKAEEQRRKDEEKAAREAQKQAEKAAKEAKKAAERAQKATPKG
ncbi:MAG TPA: pilus assembly protein N-terminal domain-containing protein [Vicinamibacterales bacterium]|nr:pilus assembly protein N-terminal domain-containing protein [Vicinamibacterales bacterium]